ncbi:MAG: insulinase family protein [Eubacteriales bacterium]|nr:insulinase family protein [Eubacteriales bacterium]
MEIYRTEITDGVSLTYLRSYKFKTACMSVSLLTQLSRETAAMNALIPFVLRRGTMRYPDMDAISAKLDELYGTAIEPIVRRFGEIQTVGFYASFPEGDFLPGYKSVLNETAELMGQLLLAPNTKGGLLLPEYVDSEREKMLDAIRSVVNDKRSYAVKRCLEEMCCYEDFAVGRYGGEDECDNIRYKTLTRQYREILKTSPIEIFYCGRDHREDVVQALKDAFFSLPRGEINYDIGTDVRMNAVEDTPRYAEDRMNVTQGKLVMGFRLGQSMEEPDFAALNVFNCVFGSGSSSKLFMNVREKLSLCYYASSALNTHKGLLIVSSGIDFDKFDQTRDEIFKQLEEVKNGNFTEDEFASAKAGVVSELRSYMDVPSALESFYLAQTLRGLDYGPMEMAEMADEVTREQVQAIAGCVECDMIYFLRNGEDEDDVDSED